MKKQSEKDVSVRTDVSVSYVNRLVDKLASQTVLRHASLPKSMNWNEFKATKDTNGKMAFIITDNDNGNIFDIQDSKKTRDLDKHFRRYSKREIDQVKHISTDFYTSYLC